MAAYAFETISAQQALAIGAGDTVTFAGRPTHAVVVAYNIPAVGPASVTITYGGRAVEFGLNVLAISERGGLDFQGDSRLLIGGFENDALVGMGEDDAIYGGSGGDTVIGQGGDDLIQGNAGDDRITAERGSDLIYGGQGNDTIRTGPGILGEAGDFAHGNMGNDSIQGGAGGDTLLGGQGEDDIHAGDGDDLVSGDLGADLIRGGLGNDTILGGAGDDTLFAGGDSGVLDGGVGDDFLVVNSGRAVAGDGEDTVMSSGPGKALIEGGAGTDRFEFMSQGSALRRDADEILDWSRNETLDFDRAIIQPAAPGSYQEIVAPDYEAALAVADAIMAAGKVIYVAAQVGGDVVVFADTDGIAGNGADAAVILAGRSLSEIDWSNIG